MGVSTDAILCFGYSLEEGYKFPWTKDDEVYDEFDWREEVAPELEDLPFQLVRHCSDDEPYYIVAIKTFYAHRGHPKTLEELDFCVGKDLIEEFNAFNAKHNIVPKDLKPSWYLCSFWG